MQIDKNLVAVHTHTHTHTHTDILNNKKLQESCTITNSIVDLQYSNIVNKEDRTRRHR